MATNTKVSDQMRELYQLWQQSGISKKEFSLRQNINYQKFIYWCGKYRTEEPGTGFVPLKVSSPDEINPAAGNMEVVFPSGAKVIFHGMADPSFVKQLVS
ncbi:hypothetical protein RCC89_18505 [Cytophagaceae bacterium ABcell3]|nr:hypothetical protein RCC89_00825 [Cytophagaceae bacterium ABcell3]WMJ72119.1 hypothetical protein RCC89_02885 [Cytophagaceae bacterium ABcell3]WMJ72223.1 hypothetical protein RCC89_03450 [Cytophagaceae bacterium ABcell3]WMJ72236.1 hypothetical protein RCC89_03520 [Cytophagaceae bacterium ABcell3]WMJ73492.1 hypothetical protein RCC89_10015 [Cytophagaceae bacterium ABcell3]